MHENGLIHLQAINALDSPPARTLAKARKVWGSSPAASLRVQVRPLLCSPPPYPAACGVP